MGKIFIITGPTCAGKDTICKAILKDKDFVNKMNLEGVVRFTSRKQRDCEENGVDYYFRSSTEMDSLILSDYFIEYSSFKKFNEDGTYTTTVYATSRESLEDPDKNYIFTGSIEVLNDIMQELPDRVVPIIIDANDRTRLKRYLNRNADDSGLEICRRFIDDNNKYTGEFYDKLGVTDDSIFYNEDYSYNKEHTHLSDIIVTGKSNKDNPFAKLVHELENYILFNA